MIHFFTHLFDTEGFVARQHCGWAWTRPLILLNQVGNLIILVSYLYIALSSYRLSRKYHDNSDNNYELVKIFTIFSLACGISTIGEITIFYWPINRFYILLRYLCGGAVFFLAYNLGPIIEYMLRIPSIVVVDVLSRNLQIEIKYRKSVEKDLEEKNEMLINFIQRLQDILKNELWLHDKRKSIEQLSELLSLIEASHEK